MKSARLAKTLGRGIAMSLAVAYAMCSGGVFAARHPVAEVSRGIPTGDKSLLTWFDLLLFVAEAVCEVVNCDAQDAGDRSNTPEDSESIVRGVIVAYANHGVNADLTPEQAANGVATVDAAIWLLDDPASLLTPETAEEFRVTLFAIRTDLERAAPGRSSR